MDTNLTEIVNPSAEIVKILESAGHQVSSRWETTCQSDTCNHLSHDAGYTAEAVTPAIEVLASEHWPGRNVGLARWRLADGSEIVVEVAHGDVHGFGGVRVCVVFGSPSPYWVRVAQASYDAACGVHADEHIAEADEDGRGGGYWTCGSSKCPNEPDFPIELVLDRLFRQAEAREVKE